VGSVYRRKRGGRYFIKYRNDAGKWVYEGAYVDKAASKQLLAKREREAARSEAGLRDPYREHRRTPLAGHVEDFVDHLRARGVTPGYVRSVRGCLNRAFAGMGATRPDDLSAQRAERFLLGIREGDPAREIKGLSARGVNAYLEALREFGRWGVERGRWVVNPFVGVRKLNVEADRRRVRRALTVPELRRVIEVARVRGIENYRRTHAGGITPEWAARLERLGIERGIIYEAMALTGLRVNETRTLEWQHLNFDRAPATLTVAARHAKARRADVILLSDDLAIRLLDWRERRASELGHAPQPGERVFCLPLHLTRHFMADCRFAGIPNPDAAGRVVDLHALRHTFAQLLVREGVHPRTAQTMLRHRAIGTTMKIYVRDDPVAQEKALAALPSLREVQHQVQQPAHPTAQEDATPRERETARIGDKSQTVGTLGENMQEAAAQGNGLDMVGVTGFEPATSASRTLRSKPS